MLSWPKRGARGRADNAGRIPTLKANAMLLSPYLRLTCRGKSGKSLWASREVARLALKMSIFYMESNGGKSRVFSTIFGRPSRYRSAPAIHSRRGPGWRGPSLYPPLPAQAH